MIRYSLLIFACLLLPACMNGSEQALKTSSTGEDVIIINAQKNYEETYQILSSNAKSCWRFSQNGSQLVVKSNLDNQAKIGKVVAYQDHLVWSKDYFVSMEVTPIDNDSSQIKLYKKESFVHKGEFAEAINSWLTGEKKCSRSAFFLLY